LPNMTPIFSRNWFVKQADRCRCGLRRAGELAQTPGSSAVPAGRRACSPHLALDLPPSASAPRPKSIADDCGGRARSARAARRSSSACLARVGLRDEQLVDVDADALPRTPGSIECSASNKCTDAAAAAVPRRSRGRRASSLPDDSGPKTSTMRPRGNPPTPSARSSDNDPRRHRRRSRPGPGRSSSSPSPLPNCRSICPERCV